MAVLDAMEARRRDQGERADLEREGERAEHCRKLLEIVDGFNPTPDLRAKVLRWMDIGAVRAWRALLGRWHELRGAPKRGRGRPRNLEARDLARGCARAWQLLSGEMPPTSQSDKLSEYYEMVEAAFGRAGLRGWHKHAREAADRVAVEREEQRPSLQDSWAVVRITSCETDIGLTAEQLREMGVFKTPPRPKKGRKPKKS